MTIISKALRASAGHPDAYCTVQIPGVCGDPTDAKTAGCVLAHWRFSGNAGGGQHAARRLCRRVVAAHTRHVHHAAGVVVPGRLAQLLGDNGHAAPPNI